MMIIKILQSIDDDTIEAYSYLMSYSARVTLVLKSKFFYFTYIQNHMLQKGNIAHTGKTNHDV